MGAQHKARVEVHRAKLHTALTRASDDVFPVNLKWMVDLFFYKHISSLTTHLKRHFREEVDYTKRPDGRRSWSYHITLGCFVKICKYARHAKRQAVSKHWMKLLSRARGGSLRVSTDAAGTAGCSDIGMVEYEHAADSSNEGEDYQEDVSPADSSSVEGGDNSDEEEEAGTTPDEDSDDTAESNEDSSEAPDSRIPEHLYSSLIAQSPATAIPFLNDWSYLRLVPLALHSFPPSSSQAPASCSSSPPLSPARVQFFTPQQQMSLQRLQAYKALGVQYAYQKAAAAVSQMGGNMPMHVAPGGGGGAYYVSAPNAQHPTKILLRPAVHFTPHLRNHNVRSMNDSSDSIGSDCSDLDSSFDTNIFLSLGDEQ